MIRFIIKRGSKTNTATRQRVYQWAYLLKAQLWNYGYFYDLSYGVCKFLHLECDKTKESLKDDFLNYLHNVNADDKKDIFNQAYDEALKDIEREEEEANKDKIVDLLAPKEEKPQEHRYKRAFPFMKLNSVDTFKLRDYLINRFNLCRIDNTIAFYNGYCYVEGIEQLQVLLDAIMNLCDFGDSFKSDTFCDRLKNSLKQFLIKDIDYSLIPFNNIVLKIDEENPALDNIKLLEHNPNLVTLNLIPHTYDQSAQSNEIEQSFKLWSDKNSEIEALLYEAVASALTLKQVFKKAFLIKGTPRGNNGKSALLKLCKYLYGAENCAETTIQDLTNTFNTKSLMNKRINLGDELESEAVKEIALLKKVISGDNIKGNEKNRAIEDYRPRCKHIFTCNYLPSFKDLALLERFIILPMEHVFSASDKVLKLQTEPNASALINLLLPHYITMLQRLKNNEHIFTKCKLVDDMKKEFETNNDSVLEYLRSESHTTMLDRLMIDFKSENDLDNYTLPAIFKEYQEYCKTVNPNNKNTYKQSNFANRVLQEFQELELKRGTRKGFKAFKNPYYFVNKQQKKA